MPVEEPWLLALFVTGDCNLRWLLLIRMQRRA